MSASPSKDFDRSTHPLKSDSHRNAPNQEGESPNILNNEEKHQAQEGYNPLAHPPNVEKAIKHGKARKVGRLPVSAKDTEGEYCEDCGLPTKNEPLPYSGSRLDLADLGAGFPLYFEYILFCGILLLGLFVVVGIYNIAVNHKGKICDLDPDCPGGLIMTLGLSNRDSLDSFKVSSILNIIFTIIGLIVAFYYRRILNMTADEVNRGVITNADYTVIVGNLPTTESPEKVKQFFEKNGMVSGKPVVKKVVMAYKIGPFVDMVRKRNTLMSKKDKGTALPNVDEQLKEIEGKLQVFSEEMSKDSTQKSAGVAFITFEGEKHAKGVISKFKMDYFEKTLYTFFSKFLGCLGIRFNRTYNGNILTLKRAPEPLDVFWENLGNDWWVVFKKRLLTLLISLFLIACSFGIILGINSAQSSAKKNTNGGTGVTLLSLLGSFIVIVINGFLGIFVRRLAGYEKHETYTYYFISIANKLSFAQFINTAIVTLIVHLIEEDHIDLSVEGSIVSKVFFLFALNAIVPSLSAIFDPWYILRCYKRRKLMNNPKNSKLNQQEANLLFEGPNFDVAQKYANVQKTLLFTGFYAFLVPIGVLFSIVGLFIVYWTDKYLLLRRMSKPHTLSKELASEMADFLELFFVMFNAGNLIFDSIAREEVAALNLIALIISIVIYVLPQKYMMNCITKEDENVYNMKTYDEVKYFFITDYDRVNPITQEDAMREWLMDLAKMAEAHEAQNGNTTTKDENKPSLSSYFQHLPPKQNTVDTLFNYANANPSFKQVQQMTSNVNFIRGPPMPHQMPMQFVSPQTVAPTSFSNHSNGPLQFTPQNPTINFINRMPINNMFNSFVNNMQQMFPGNPFVPQAQQNPFRPQQQVQPQRTPGSHIPQKVVPQSHIPQSNNNNANFNRPPQNMAFQPVPQPQPQPQLQFQPQPQPQPQPQMQFQPQPQRNPGPPFQPAPANNFPLSQGFAMNTQPMNQPMGPGFMGQPQMQFGYNQPQNPPMMQPNMNQPPMMQPNMNQPPMMQPNMNQPPMMQGNMGGFGFQMQNGPAMNQGQQYPNMMPKW